MAENHNHYDNQAKNYVRRCPQFIRNLFSWHKKKSTSSSPKQLVQENPQPIVIMNHKQQLQLKNSSTVSQKILIEKKQQKSQTFQNDDQTYLESVKKTKKQEKIKLLLRAQRSQIKLGEPTTMPAMCSLIAGQGIRTSVDLICVIDVSGSMAGQKIACVKETMNFLLNNLTPSDRLSIIIFSHQGRIVCPLRAVTKENRLNFSQQINSLRADGGTTITSGMNLAFQTIRDRQIANTVTSIFLLSDGQDSGADLKIKQALSLQQNQGLGTFSIHCFGFGTDHDEDLMTNIAKLRDGTFYFIKEPENLDEAFCNALGGIISLIASQVYVTLRLTAKNLLKGTKITKVFGDKWHKINQGEYSIKLTQLMSEVSKDFVFELTFPAIKGKVSDLDRQHVIVEAFMKANGLYGQQMISNQRLTIALINKNEKISQINQNIDVIQNYLRVKASQLIEENMRRAQANQYQQAQKSLNTMINQINSEKKIRKQKKELLLRNLNSVLSKCQPIIYESEGRKCISATLGSLDNQSSFQFSNTMQKQMTLNSLSKHRQNRTKSNCIEDRVQLPQPNSLSILPKASQQIRISQKLPKQEHSLKNRRRPRKTFQKDLLEQSGYEIIQNDKTPNPE